MNSLKEQGRKAFAWDFIGKIAIHISSFIVTIFLARLLEPSDFGTIAMIMVVVTIATAFSDIGLGGALIQRRKVHPIHYSSVFYFNISIGFLLTTLTFFSASWISSFYNNELLVLVIEVISIIFVISAFHTVQSVILRKELNHKLLTKISFIASISSGFVGVILALLDAGVWSLVVQILFREFMINIIIWKSTHWKPDFKFSLKALKQLWSYGFNMFLASLLNTIYERIDYIIIGKLFLPATLGYFHQAKQLNTLVIKYSSGSLMSVLFPVLSKIQKDTERFQRVVVKSLGVICFVTFFILGELYLVSEELILILLGTKWEASVYFFKILVLSGFAYPISALMVNILSSRGKSKKFLKLEIYKKVIQTLNLIILYKYGIEIFLYGLIFTSIFNTGLNIKFAIDEIKLKFLYIVQPIVIQSLIVIFVVYGIEQILNDYQLGHFVMLIIKSLLFISSYIIMNWLLKTSSYIYIQEEIKLVLNSKKRKNDK